MTSKLKEAREKAGYTIEEVSDILKIRKKYIVDLEEGILEDMPGEVYIKGYTKVYYEFLGLERPKAKGILVKVQKTDAVDDKINKKYIILISSIGLLFVISLYAFINFCPEGGSTEDVINNNENNEATIN